MAVEAAAIRGRMSALTLEIPRPEAHLAKASLEDFPLPQEIKDQIFGYLFDANTTSYIPRSGNATHSECYNSAGGTAHAYAYDTAILRVNKAIGAKAALYLFQTSGFIRINYMCADFLAHLHLLGVPVVADNDSVNRVRHHSFTIDLTWRNCPLNVSVGGDYRRQGSALILQRDQSRLWCLLRYYSQYAAFDVPQVTSERGQSLSIRMPPACRFNPNFDVEIFATERGYGVPNTKRKADFLRSMEVVAGGLYNCKLHGFDLKLVARLFQSTCPRIVWLSALAWNRFDTLLCFKQEADALAVQGEYHAALARYSYILACARINVGSRQDTDWRYCLLSRDMEASCMWISLRQDLRYTPCDSERIQNHVSWKSGFNHLPWYGTPGHHHMAMITLLLRSKATALEYHSYLSHLVPLHVDGQTGALQHDIKVITQALQHTPDPLKLVNTDLSICTMPFTAFDSQTNADPVIPSRPNGLVGGQDVNHLAEFTEQDKKTVKQMQAQHGIPISKF